MKTTTLFGFAATTLLLIALPTVARQQPPKMGMGAKMEGKMPESCKMMMQMHQKMGASNKAQDLKLKGLMAEMDKAPRDQKMKAMTGVINELLEQRRSHQKMMDQMQPQMMEHMRAHMQSGDKAAMMQCPMMGKGGMMGHDMSKMKNK